jgi:heterodisulfide reductase subunit A
VSGQVGNFTVAVKQKPRYIDMDKCIACGICAEKCPKTVPDDYNLGLSKRKAAFILYGQTVPLKYVIDPVNCIYTTKGKCRACEKFCPTGAIDFDEREKIINFNVGAVILSPGHAPFDPSGLDFYGYGKIADVVTSLEYERMLSPGGPTHGHLEKLSDGRPPEKIAWIQCVGSRNTNRSANGYCSSVCCMYAMKQALITAAHIPGRGEQTIFNMDVRCHGKEFERYYDYAKNNGLRFVRARPHTIEPGPDGSGVMMTYTTEDGRQLKESFDMAVLSIGMGAPADALDLAAKSGIELTSYSFAKTGSFNPVAASRPGIFVGGTFKAPMNIPSAVAQASAAAAEAARALIAAKGTLTREKQYPEEADISDQAPRIGVFVCSCGINIAQIIDVADVVAYAQTLPNVVYAGNNLFSCSTDTQNQMGKIIRENGINRIVIAACSPRTHESLFQDTLRELGLNGYLVEMANIRNHNAWVHQKEPEKATAKAKDQVRMAAARVSIAGALKQLEVQVIQKALVIGGGVAGMQAALGLADQGFETVLVEKSDRLGGNAWHLATTSQGEPVRPMLEDLITRVNSHERIEVFTDARIISVSGIVGSFSSEVTVGDRTISVQYGAAVLATGARESVPAEYLYGEDLRVLTHLQLDDLMESDPARIRSAQSAVFIQCVGSRDDRRPYCSRLCCTHSVSSAIGLKTRNPDMNVYILYRDMRTYGLNEDLYTRAREMGVIFIRYDLEHKPRVAVENGDLVVRVKDPIIDRALALETDLLVLASAVEPNDVSDLVTLYRCAVNPDGFLNEAHPKLRPVDMAVDGLFVAGIGVYPKPIHESIAQAKAAASRAGVVLSRKVMHLDAIKSYVTENCDGCALCLDVCPYQAISLKLVTENGRQLKRIETEKALCKGCGVCEATCPKEGVLVHGFTTAQLRAQVFAALDLPN